MILTMRQKEIASLVSQVLTTKSIAREVGLAVPTIKDHVKRAAARLPGETPPRHKLIGSVYFAHRGARQVIPRRITVRIEVL